MNQKKKGHDPRSKGEKKEIGKPCWRTLNGIIIIIATGLCVCV